MIFSRRYDEVGIGNGDPWSTPSCIRCSTTELALSSTSPAQSEHLKKGSVCSFVETCASGGGSHRGPHTKAPPSGALGHPLTGAPQCPSVLPGSPLTPDLSHHTATYWVALAGNHKSPPAPTSSILLSKHQGWVQFRQGSVSWACKLLFIAAPWSDNVFPLKMRFYIGSITSTCLTQSESTFYQKTLATL